jgi:hypothetical protein
VSKSHEYFMNTQLLDLEDIPGRTYGIKVVSVTVRDELRMTGKLCGDPLDADLMGDLIRGKLHV